MTTYGKKNRNFGSPFKSFHRASAEVEERPSHPSRVEDNSDELSRQLNLNWTGSGFGEHARARPIGRSSSELSRPINWAAGGVGGRARPASIQFVDRGPAQFQRPFLTLDRQHSRSTIRALPQKPAEKDPRRIRVPKVILGQKASNAKLFTRRTRSQSPGKSARKLLISEPFDFKHSQSSTRCASNLPKENVDHVPDPEASEGNTTDMAPEKLSVELKAPLSRSTSAFAFSSPMSHVGHSLGNVFRFGHKNKCGRPSTPPRDSSHKKILASNNGNNLPRDRYMREAISDSPQLQRFFFGTKISDGQKSTRRPAVYDSPAVDEKGSPTKSRRSMYDLRQVREHNIRAGWEKGLHSETELHRKSLGVNSNGSDELAQDYTIAEPTYQFAEMIKPRLIPTSGETSEMPRLVQEGPDASRTGTRDIAESVTRQNFDENISGLWQHPKVNDFAKPPDWYVGPSKRAEDLGGRPQRRGYSTSRKSHTLENSAFIGGLPIPSIKLKPASNTSKRSSTEAELTVESPQKLRRSKTDGLQDDAQAGFELMTAFCEIHGNQHGDDDSVFRKLSQTGISSKRSGRDKDIMDARLLDRELSPLNEMMIPGRHPGRLVRPNMPLSMENTRKESETHIPYSNYSTPWPGRSRWGQFPRHGDCVPTTIPPRNTPNLSESPSLPTRRGRMINQETHSDGGDDELEAVHESFDIGLAE